MLVNKEAKKKLAMVRSHGQLQCWPITMHSKLIGDEIGEGRFGGKR